MTHQHQTLISKKVKVEAEAMPRDQYVRRSLLLLALQVGGEEKKADVRDQILKGREYWCIAFDLGASGELIRELGGPAI